VTISRSEVFPFLPLQSSPAPPSAPSVPATSSDPAFEEERVTEWAVDDDHLDDDDLEVRQRVL
jgi:hypothetical protein